MSSPLLLRPLLGLRDGANLPLPPPLLPCTLHLSLRGAQRLDVLRPPNLRTHGLEQFARGVDQRGPKPGVAADDFAV